MATVHINKESAAQRQIDAAIRMLFLGEDTLAVHTVAAAGLRLTRDLANHRGVQYESQLYDNVLKDLYRELVKRVPSDEEIQRQSPELKLLMYRVRSRPTNFLKHADNDPGDFLSEDDLKTDDVLLEACSLFVAMGFEPTVEMRCFGRWHLAVYPHEDGDSLIIADGPIHELPREHQLEFGQFMLEHCQSTFADS